MYLGGRCWPLLLTRVRGCAWCNVMYAIPPSTLPSLAQGADESALGWMIGIHDRASLDTGMRGEGCTSGRCAVQQWCRH